MFDKHMHCAIIPPLLRMYSFIPKIPLLHIPAINLIIIMRLPKTGL